MSSSEALTAILNVLSRRTQIDALSALRSALQVQQSSLPLKATAIAFDTTVFMRIAKHERYDLLADYLVGQHIAPLILPGQAIQEFWNNQHDAVTTLAQPIRSALSNLQSAVSKAGLEMEGSTGAISEAVERFEIQYGHMYDQAAVSKVLSMLDLLSTRAHVPFAPRDAFIELARHRKLTKTPPGFKDAGDGDFFIWVDFLFGLITEKSAGKIFTRALLVTNDTKKDWCRKDAAHPVLVAEAMSLLQVPFEIWDLQKFVNAVAADA